MIHNALPFAMRRPNNPALNHELRRMRWPYQRKQLFRYTVVVFLVIGILLFGAWAVGAIDNYATYCTGSNYAAYSCQNGTYYITLGESGEAGSILFFTLLAGIGGSFIIDLFYVVLPIQSILRDIQSGHWELLRLTNIRGEDLIAAKYEVNQIRAWRGLAFELAVHTAGMLMVLLTFISYFTSFESDAGTSFFLMMLAILLAIYVMEPLWRMRALVVLGMFVAMRVRNFTFAMLSVFGAVFAMRIVQIIIIIAFIYFTIQMSNNNESSTEIAVFFMLLAFFATVYFFYRKMRDVLFSRIFRLVNQGER